VIRNAEHLTGFTDREIEIMAQVARYHRKSAPKSKHIEYARLSPRDQSVVRTLAGILRVAVSLDRSYRKAVQAITCKDDGKTVELHLHATGDTSLEVYTADDRKGLLEECLERTITLA
jgi:exopolyphosphatase/guanosine-5'-triphosphate,3'-diphosphate pyrophosphatase